MKQFVRSLGDLEIGIKQLLLENRCSFSDEDKALLNDCLTVIEQAKESKDFGLVTKILEILSKFLAVSEQFKDFF